LLNLISDILDLSKIESGTVSVEAEEVFFEACWTWWLVHFATRRKIVDSRSRSIPIRISRVAWSRIRNDCNRVLKNLLSNAFKFTEEGVCGCRLIVGEWLVQRPSDLGTAHPSWLRSD